MNKKILIVDDDPDILDAMGLALELEGYSVYAVQKAVHLEKLVRKTSPGIILLDVLLSGRDGREICRELKNNPQTRHIPIIMVSAHPSAGENALDFGAENFIAKPFEINELLEKVKKYTK